MSGISPVGFGGGRGPYVATNAMNPAPGSVLSGLAKRAVTPAVAATTATATFVLASAPVQAHNGGAGSPAAVDTVAIDPVIGGWLGLAGLVTSTSGVVLAGLTDRGSPTTFAIGALGVFCSVWGVFDGFTSATLYPSGAGLVAFGTGLAGCILGALTWTLHIKKFWLQEHHTKSAPSHTPH